MWVVKRLCMGCYEISEWLSEWFFKNCSWLFGEKFVCYYVVA